MVGERASEGARAETRSGSSSARSGGPRETTGLVLRVLRGRGDGVDRDGGPFLVRRAVRDVAERAEGRERAVLSRVLEAGCSSPASDGRDAPPFDEALLEWAGFLEARGRLPEAASVLDLARTRRPSDPVLLLHRARVARRAGRRERARRLYARLREGDGVPEHLVRMARIGAALLADDPEAELSTAVRAAVRAGDGEAAAVGLEARARVRRRCGDVAGAFRDYGCALLRFDDPVDRGRVGHELADLCLAERWTAAAREVLRAVERFAHPAQASRAASRLFALALSVGDEVGCRRWRSAGSSGLVSLAPSAASGEDAGPSRVDRWLRRLRRRFLGATG